MIVNNSFNFCWLCGDEVEDMEEMEVTPDCTIWLCTKHAMMRDRTQDKEIRRQKEREVSAWREWVRASPLDIGITRSVVNGVTFIHRR